MIAPQLSNRHREHPPYYCRTEMKRFPAKLYSFRWFVARRELQKSNFLGMVQLVCRCVLPRSLWEML
jgi:hypothetical protein